MGGSTPKSGSKRPPPTSNFSDESEDQPELDTSSQGSTGTEFIFSYDKYREAIATLICVMMLPLNFAESCHFLDFIRQISPPFMFTYDRYKKATAKLICQRSLRFNFADNPCFENFIKQINPQAERIPAREIVKEITELVNQSKLELINVFANTSSKVSICWDLWSDSQKEFHYVEITCHWIDDTWTPNKRLLAHKYIDFKQPASDISSRMHRILKKYGLDRKVFSISFDNESVDVAGLDSLISNCQQSIDAKFFYTRCISNVLTTCVGDILDMFDDEIKPIRKAIWYLFRDNSSTRNWGRFCEQSGLPPKYFHADMPTRWISSYKMLNNTNQYGEVLSTYFVEQQYDNGMSAYQWDLCYNICQLLKTFKDATKELSGVYYPTSVLVVDHFVKIAVHFNSLMGCDSLGECIAKIMGKWLDCFCEIPDIFLIAKLLDPRIRVDGLEEMLGFYYDALFPIKDDKTPIPSVIVANAKQCLFHIFNEYRIKHSENLGINTSSSDDHSSLTLAIRLQNFYNEKLGKFPRSYDSSNPNQEIEAYLAADFEFLETESFDILKWWSRWRLNFPIVSLIAKDVLAVPASIASFEQAFRRDGYIVKDWECELLWWTREKKRLLGDWANAEFRRQEMDTDEDEDDSIDTESVDDPFDD